LVAARGQELHGADSGLGYTDEGFEVLFKGKADPNVISIIREVIGDVPLKIYENATCKELSIPGLEEGAELR